MNDNRSQRLSMKDIFFVASEIPDGADREAYLRKAVGDNAELLLSVRQILADAENSSPNRFDKALATVDQLTEEEDTSAIDITTRPLIGPYKLVHSLGDGGMGEVFLAEQREPIQRTVALKLIKRGMDSDEVLARFEAERQALAMLDHPHIAKVLDAGQADDGRPYFVMELVRGIPITEYCDQHKLDTRTRLKLLVEVCHAVQHAHQKGIIHRDLKPSNILVELHDVRHVPKVIDFGVAKAINQRLTKRTLITHFTQLVGTPLYMSPEQAELSGQDVDTRSDVYTLGLLMYELLTGTTPFDKETLKSAGFDEMRRMIREDDPPRPSHRISTLNEAQLSTLSERQQVPLPKLKRSIERELDWIVLKALEKDRVRRYHSAIAMADDIQRHLDGDAVHAHPPSRAYSFAKFARRNRSALTAAFSVMVMLAIATGISAWQVVTVTHQKSLVAKEKRVAEEKEKEAVHQRDVAQQNQYVAEIVAGQTDWQRGNLSRLQKKLLGHLPNAEPKNLRDWEWYYLFSKCHPERQGMRRTYSTSDVTWSPDGRFLGSHGTIWRADTGKMVRRFSSSRALEKPGAWSHDSQMYAWGTASEWFFVWDRSSDEVQPVRGHEASVWCLAWSPDGRQLASGSIDHSVRIWDVASWTVTKTIETGHNVTDVAWSPDGNFLAIGVHKDELRIWKRGDKEPVRIPHVKGSRSLSWHPDGSQLAAFTAKGWYLLNKADWTIIRQQEHSIERYSGDIAWSPDGEEIAVAEDNAVSLWMPVGARPKRVLRGHVRGVESVAWGPNGKEIATVDKNGDLKIWDLGKTTSPAEIFAGEAIGDIEWRSDSAALVATRLSDGSRLTWNLEDGRLLNVQEAKIDGSIHWSPSGKYIAQIIEKEAGPEINVWDKKASVIRSIWKGNRDETVLAIAWSNNAARLAIKKTVNQEMVVELWDVDGERPISQWTYNGPPGQFEGKLAWSHDGCCVGIAALGDRTDNATVTWQGHVYLVDVNSGVTKLKHNLGGWRDRGTVMALEWSTDDRSIVAGTSQGLIEVIDVEQRRAVLSTRLHNSGVCSLTWSPSGRRIVSCDSNGEVKVWTADGGQDLLSFHLEDRSTDVRWSPNGRVLAAVTETGRIHVWNASTGYEFSESGERQGELAWSYYYAGNGRLTRPEFLRLAPDSLEYWEARGHAWANLGDFGKAAEEFAKSCRSGVKTASNEARFLSFALLGDGQYQAFSEHRQAMLAALAELGDPPGYCVIVAWAYVIASSDGLEGEEIVRLAQLVADDDPGDNASNLLLGGALYRDGQFQAAADLLGENLNQFSQASDPHTRTTHVATLYFLAMARQNLGHPFQARRYLDEASEAFQRFSDSLAWYQRVQLRSLREEATTLIGHDE